MPNIQSSLKKCQQQSAPSDDEKYWVKHEGWNQRDITLRTLALNNDQLMKLSPKEYETLVDVGNRTYPLRKNK